MKLYLFSFIFIVLVGVFAYAMGTKIPDDPERYSTPVVTSTVVRTNSTSELIPNQTHTPTPATVSNSSSAPAPIPSPPQNQTPISTPIPTTDEELNLEIPIQSARLIQIENVNDIASAMPTEKFESKINSKVSFLVPIGSKVIESGTITNIVFAIQTPESKKFSMTFNKIENGCFDPIGSFGIPSGLGVDFRIIQDNKEVTLTNAMRAVRSYEMYGSYAGSIGFRSNACIRSAIPTKIEIKAVGFGRYEGAEAYKVFETILTNLKV